MTQLFQQVSLLVEDLRNQNLSAAQARMPELEAQYSRILAALNQVA